jgi:hypothetical protein
MHVVGGFEHVEEVFGQRMHRAVSTAPVAAKCHSTWYHPGVCLALHCCQAVLQLAPFSCACSFGGEFDTLRASAWHHDQHGVENVDARDCLQITCFTVLASGVPFLSASQGTGPKYWGFSILPWAAAILLPLFLLFSIGLAIFELYYEFTTTSGRGRPFRRLLASLRVPGERRTAADVRTIHKALAESEFLQRYPVSMLLRLCRKCELLELKPDEAVFREGEVGHHFYVLIHGTVDVSVADVSDKSSPPRLKYLNSLHDSGSFGERALTEVRCSLTATTADCVATMGANRACRKPWLVLT